MIAIRVLRFGALALVVFVAVAQAFRIDKTNPPVTADLDAPAPVKEVMTRACYGCHSNETVWPWYSNVAPASWMVAYDVRQGRAELNFSQWGAYTQTQRLKKLREIRDEVAAGEMPPWYYVHPMHPEARLSAESIATIEGWIESESAALKQGR